MKTYIVLLRGINVSGKNKLPMIALRELLHALDYQNVQTYIQSGNIILTTDEAKSTISQKIKKALYNQFGYDVPVIVKTVIELEEIINNYPFSTENEKIVAFTFLSSVPQQTTVEINKHPTDNYKIFKDVVYLYCPTGFAKTKLTNNLFEKKLKVTATTRNLRTTHKLLILSLTNVQKN